MSFSHRSLWFVLALALLAWPGYALDPNRAVSQYVADRWTAEQGLPSGTIYGIAQTQDGYLWIASLDGLTRFDGLQFHLIGSPPESPRIGIMGVASDRDGSLWVRLPNTTVARYRVGPFDSHFEAYGPTHSMNAFARSRNGEFLAAKDRVGVMSYVDGVLKVIAPAHGLPRSPIIALAQTGDGAYWLGTHAAGLFRVAGGITSPVREGLPDQKINCLLPDGRSGLWIGTDQGIARWDGYKVTTEGLPSRLSRQQILAMLTDRDGNLWVGTDSGDLVRVNGNGVASLARDRNELGFAITALFEDREGALWVGGANGMERLRDSPFVTYSLPEGLPTDGDNPVFVDQQDRMWFPPACGGLWWVKGDQHGRITNDGLERDVVYTISGRNGELWVGRRHGGLTRLRRDGDSFTTKTYTVADGLPQNSVYSVYQSRDGTVWAGTLSGGVTELNAGRFTSFTVADGLVSNTIAAIVESVDGSMWFATSSGLSVFSKNRWRSFTMEDGLPSEDVYSLLQDSDGVLWVGTAAGLAYLDAGRFHAPKGGPRSLQEPLLGLVEDNFGSFWIATSNHVLRVNREALLRGGFAAGDIREYGVEDGLRGVEGVKRYRSVVADPSGRVWFSLNRGISVVDPARLRGNSAAAIPQIQGIFADGSPINLRGNTHIAGGRKRITFGYAGLSLSIPERVRFRYRLDDYDHDWSDPVSTREAGYTNLSPGSYRFRVIACNPDGVWSGAEAFIAFQIDPLFWQAWWFRLGCLVAVVAGVLALYRLRLHQLTRSLNLRFEERLSERTRIARDLHDTLLQSFQGSLIQMQAARNTFSRRPEQAGRPLDDAITMAEGAIAESRDAIQNLRSQPVAQGDLAELLTVTGQDLARSHITGHQVTNQEANETPVIFRVTVEGERKDLDPYLQDEAYRIARELLRNAFRHARARHIEVDIRYDDRLFRMRIRDDGKGIERETLKEGGRAGHWGLLGMQERAKRIGAQLDFWSGTGAGTEAELSIPSSIAYTATRRAGGFQLRRRKVNS